MKIDTTGLGTKELYTAFKEVVYNEENQELKEKYYKKVRFGIKQNFDINDFLVGRFWGKKKTGKIRIGNTWLTMEQCYTEIEEREALMQKAIEEGAPSEITKFRKRK